MGCKSENPSLCQRNRQWISCYGTATIAEDSYFRKKFRWWMRINYSSFALNFWRNIGTLLREFLSNNLPTMLLWRTATLFRFFVSYRSQQWVTFVEELWSQKLNANKETIRSERSYFGTRWRQRVSTTCCMQRALKWKMR